ncbi:MAG: hypothetical protein EZS28_019119 [Streblomastix strix]|uniref:MATE family efflux transporter n=1 Tax=Streblomastix strix TaxID=222440 RepID=A0A5J4VRY9_9EUKA|nr:MAG: hypothetical protein EZS28_019119 [Streblomastix strix]
MTSPELNENIEKLNKNPISKFFRWNGIGGSKELLKLAAPMLLSEGSNTICMFIERIILGRYIVEGQQIGFDACVVSVSYSVIAVILWVLIGLTIYCAMQIAQRIGNNQDLVGETLWQGFYASIIAAIFAAALIPVVRPILSFLSNNDDDDYMKNLINAEVNYSTIIMSLMIMFLLYNMSSLFFGAVSETTPVVIVNLVCVGINALLDYLLIIVFRLGYRGAAYAICSSKFIGVVIFMILIFRRRDFRDRFKLIKLSSLKPQIKFLIRAVLVGLMVGLVNGIDSFVWMMFLILQQNVGEAAVTSAGYIASLYETIMIVIYGISAALQLIASKNIGNIDAIKNSILTGIKFIVPYAVIFVILELSLSFNNNSSGCWI